MASRRGLESSRIRLVVCIDQLEECWSTLADDVRAAFDRCLVALSKEGRIWVIATIRSDFVGRMEETPEYTPLLKNGTSCTLLPPQPDELVEMIREPAFAAGLTWESREGVSLDQAILREASANPESLPLLEYTLDQLYERRRGASLTFDAYREFGGLPGSIAATAERCVAEHAGASPETLARVLRPLVGIGPGGVATRRYAQREEFPEGTSESRLLDAFVQRRLCVADAPGGSSAVAFSHEALLSAWPRLQSWLVSETSLLQARELVAADAAEWRRRGRPVSLLATAPEKVADARRLTEAGVPLGDDTSEYVRASLRRTAWLRRLRAAAVAGVSALAVIAAAAALYARSERDDALRARAQALARESARALSAGDRETAMRLVDEAAAVWKDGAGRPDPEVAFEQLRTDLVRQIATDTEKYEPLATWHFNSREVRSSNVLFLGTLYGDTVAVDPASGRSTLLKNYGGSILAAAVSADGRYGVVDSSGMTRYDRTGQRADVVPNVLSSFLVQCDGTVCHGLGWNLASNRCEWTRTDIGSAATVSHPLEAAPGSPLPRPYTQQTCAWNDLALLAERRLMALDRTGRVVSIRVDETDRAQVELLRDNVASFALVDESTAFLHRGDVLEVLDPATGRSEVKSRSASMVSSLNVSVRGGLVAAISSDGGTEIVSNGRVYGLGRTGLIPIRVFELPRTRAALEVNSSGLVRAIDYEAGRELYRWHAAPTPLRAAFFSATDHRLSVLTTAGSLRVWDVAGLEATGFDAPGPAAAAGKQPAGVARRTIALDVMAGGSTEPTAEQRAPVLVDPETDLAVLRGSREALFLHRGTAYRMRDFAARASTRTADGASWLLTDGRRIVRLRRPSTGARPADPEIMWQGKDDDGAERILALEGGGVAVVLRTAIVLLDAQGAERARLTRESVGQRLDADLVRAREIDDVLVLETAACSQRRVHVPTSRLVYEVSRLCGGLP
jgi:hypothetical protein